MDIHRSVSDTMREIYAEERRRRWLELLERLESLERESFERLDRQISLRAAGDRIGLELEKEREKLAYYERLNIIQVLSSLK